MNQKWIEWQLKNAGADQVICSDSSVTAHVAGWTKTLPYKSDRETVIALTRAIRDHKAGK